MTTQHEWECTDCGATVLFRQPEQPQDDYHSEQNESRECSCGGDMYFDEVDDGEDEEEDAVDPPAALSEFTPSPKGNYRVEDIKTMSADLFDWEHSSRHTGNTVPGLKVEEDGTILLQSWHGMTPKGITRDKKIIDESEYSDLAIALEFTNGEWFWMHIADYSLKKVEPLDPDQVKLIVPEQYRKETE